MKFLDQLDKDIRKILIAQLRNLWTHTSTAIEGNTLTLGETAFVIEDGLTVSGKPLKDHQEVVGHARAIDLIYDLVRGETKISEEDIFNLHKAVQTEAVFDVYKPVGKWKVEPKDVAVLMNVWLELLNSHIKQEVPEDKAICAYSELHVSFVRIHPFYNGNGRMARLISNIPVLKSGFPPVIIPKERRWEYIMALTEYHLSAGHPKPDQPLVPAKEKLEKFRTFCAESWKESMELVHAAQKKQSERNRTSH